MKAMNGQFLVAMDPFAREVEDLRPALKTAMASAECLGLPVRATAVVSPDQLNWPNDFQKTWKSEFQSLGDKALRHQLKQLFPKAPIPVHALMQPWHSVRESTKSLVNYAAAKKASAVVVFTHYKKKASFSFPGSFVSTLVSASRTPILAINARAEAVTKVKTILFATDFSKEDARSFVQAQRWAKDMGAQLILFHAITLPAQTDLAASAGLVGGWANLEEYRIEQETWVTKMAEKWIQKAAKAGVETQFVLSNTSYSASLAVLKIVEKKKVDMIIVTVKTGPTAAFFLGSVTRDILAKSERPVLVLPSRRQMSVKAQASPRQEKILSRALASQKQRREPLYTKVF